MKKILFCLSSAFFLLSFFPGLRAEEVSLTLDEAVSLALRDNRSVLLKNEDVKIAKSRISEARSGLFPGLTVGGGWSDTRGSYSKDVSKFSAQAGLKQIIYSGGKVINTIKFNEYNYIATEAVLDKARLETILNVKQVFYILLLSDKFIQLNKSIVDNTKEHLAFLEARFSQGQASESGVIKMRSSLAGVVQAYEFSLNQAESAQALLQNLLFLDKEIRVKAKGQFGYEPKEIAYDEAFLTALQSRPEIRQLEAQKNAAENGVAIAKAGNRPQVSAAWDYYSSSVLATGTTKNWNDYNVLGISVSWPVFDGWLTKSKMEQALIEVKEARILKEKAVKDILLELKTAYLELKDAIEKIKVIVEQIKVYQDNLSVVREQYQAGVASELDLHDAQLSYNVALFNQIQAYYDYVTAKAKFDKATGGRT